jgi:cobalt/nickel transport system permease protein
MQPPHRIPALGAPLKKIMHLPDAFLDGRTTALTASVAAAGLVVALRQVKTSLQPRQVPLLGLAGAFVFAAQMINFPVPGGTSGHLLGGVLTAILLGPAAAVLVISCVLIVQCLMFADGGLLALGANIFNMGIVSVCGGYAAYCLLKNLIPANPNRSMVFAAAFAGWFGTVLASVTCAGQLAFSNTAPWSVTFPAMANIHMLIGVGEGLATGLILLAILRTRPELLYESAVPGESQSRTPLIGLGLLVCLGLAMFVAPFASPWPDGLEKVAQQLGFADRIVTHLSGSIPTPMPDYRLPWVGSATVATALAGACGTMLAFVAAYMFARAVVPSTRRAQKG